MYFIVENKNGELTILKRFDDKIHSMVNIIMSLTARDIKYFESEDKITEDGTYCIKVTDTLYKIVERTSYEDGYVLYGYVEYETKSFLNVLYFKEDDYDFKEVCKDIKVCSHNIKMKKISKLDMLRMP